MITIILNLKNKVTRVVKTKKNESKIRTQSKNFYQRAVKKEVA